VLLILACGDDDARSIDCSSIGIDRPKYLLVTLRGAQHEAVALRSGADDWEPLPPGKAFHEVCVADRYVVGVTCEGLAVQYARLASDGDELEVFQCGGTSGYVNVSGSMRQAGFVAIGTSATSEQTGPWTYEHRVTDDARHDVLASDAFDIIPNRTFRMALRRGRHYETDSTEPEIDLDKEGHALLPVEVSATGLEADDWFETHTWLETESGEPGDFNWVSRQNSLIAYRVPRALLRAGETDWILFSAATSPYRRYATTTSAAFELMPRLSFGVTLEPGTPSQVRWTALPSGYTDVTLREGGRAVYATRPWIELAGADSLAFDLTMPGLDPRHLGAGDQPEFGVYARSADSQMSTFIRSP
jgi:hypothetical protein